MLWAGFPRKVGEEATDGPDSESDLGAVVMAVTVEESRRRVGAASHRGPQRKCRGKERGDMRNGRRWEDVWASSLVTWDRLIHAGKGMLNETCVCDSSRDGTLIKPGCTHFSSKATYTHRHTHIHVWASSTSPLCSFQKLLACWQKVFFSMFVAVNFVSSWGGEMFCSCIVIWLCTLVLTAELHACRQLHR